MPESTRAVAAAFAGNAALAALKGVAALSTGSAALLAETFHSIADTGNQALLFLGMRLARRAPDRAHPFGYGKDVYFWAFIVALMLFCLGGAFSIWEAVRKILHPSAHPVAGGWAYAVVGGSFLFEGASLCVALRSLAGVRRGRPLLQYWRESRDPTLRTVLLEDSAALLSLAIAGSGIWLSGRTGNPLWDALASGLIGCVLVAVAILLALENHSLLLGEAAPARIEERIRALATRQPEIVRVLDLRTMHLGPNDVFIALQVQFQARLQTDQIESTIRELEQAIERALPGRTHADLIAIEPAKPESGPESCPDA